MSLGIDASNQNNSFLIDSGAEISLIKVENIKTTELINIQEKCNITGINLETIETLGTISTFLNLPNGIKIPHKFQIVPQDLPIPTDGILGRDFLVNYRCMIDYDTWTLTGNSQSGYFELMIEDNFNGELLIPSRCEVYRRLDIKNLNSEFVLSATEIKPGVFCSNTIIGPTNSIVKFINTTNKPVKIPKTCPNTITPLSEYEIFTFNNNKQEERNDCLFKELNINEKTIDSQAKEKLIKLCAKYNDIFALQTDTLTCNNFYKQQIKLNDESPVYIKNYRLPEAHKQEINEQVNKLLDDGIIRNSISPYNSPLLLVPKKSINNEKNWRLVVDFRQLNKKIIADKFPLPRIDDILDQLGRAKYFTTLDLASGFHQIELKDESKQYTAFSTTAGHYEFNRLPFGLNISPNSFQRMMTIALSGLPPECAFLYIDDIIVIGCSINHHLLNLEKVFKALQKYNLKLNPKKCNFFCPYVTYLGHQITSEGIQPDKAKYATILNFPTPKDADEVRRFVAFTNYYRRFIPYFSDITAPLNNLLKKNVTFDWTKECQKAFDTLKQKLLSPVILKFPDFTKKFILYTDASKIASGAVLTQKHGDIELPIAYASKNFTRGEKNKSTIEQELTAIHWAITHFRPYLYGRRFTVKTDHRPLVYLFSMKNPSSKLTRMRLELEEYTFDIEYVKGKENVSADALSRICIDSDELKDLSCLPVQTRNMTKLQQNTQHNTNTNSLVTEIDHLRAYESVNNLDAFNMHKVIFDLNDNMLCIRLLTKNLKRTVAQAQLFYNGNNIDLKQSLQTLEDIANKMNIKTLAMKMNDKILTLIPREVFKKACNENLKFTTIILYVPAQIINDEESIQKIISENHDTPTGGHIGTRRLLQRLRPKYYWTNMKRTIAEYIKQCDKCIKNKHRIKTKEQFIETTTPIKCFELVSIDTIGPLTKSKLGNRYALTIQCDLSKYVIIAPIPDKNAQTLAKAFVENLILVYGCPFTIKSDLGTEYKNELFKNICAFLSINQKFSTAYHPETIGGLERNHRVLNEYLRHFINEQHDDWDTWLQYYTFCYNTTIHTDHNFSPFELVFGKVANMPSSIKNTISVDPQYNYDSYLTELKYKIQVTALKAKRLLERSKTARIKNHSQNVNPIDVKLHDKVYLKKENRKKLDNVYSGPYEIIAIEHPNVTIKNCLTNENQIVHKNRIIIC